MRVPLVPSPATKWVIGYVPENLRAGCLIVDPRIRFVRVLVEENPVGILLRQAECQADRSIRPFFGR